MLAERIHLLPPMRWRLAEVPLNLDYPYWVDDPDFDLDFHVRELALPPPGTQGKLAEQVARLVARPLDRARPLWELYLIHGLEGGNMAMLTKIHHSTVDGLSGAEIMGVLFDLQPTGREIPDGRVRSGRIPSDLEMLARGVAGLPRYPLRMLRALPTALPNLDETAFTNIPGAERVANVSERLRTVLLGQREGGELERSNLKPPRTSFNGRVSPHRRFVFGQLSLDEVKAVKNAHDVTVNDVVVAICAGAVRRWLISHVELPADPLVVQIPVSVRTDEQQGTFGNRIMLMSAPLHTNEPDPVKRLQLTHESLDSMKKRHRAMPAAAASGRQPLHPTRSLRSRRPRDDGIELESPRAADLEPGHLQRSRTADPALLRRRRAQGQLPGVGDHRRDGAEHHRDELLRKDGFRHRHRPRPDARRLAHGRVARRSARGASRDRQRLGGLTPRVGVEPTTYRLGGGRSIH